MLEEKTRECCMNQKTQISFRIDEKTHLKAKELLTNQGGVSKYLKQEAEKFVSHEVSLSPYIGKSSSKYKRVSLKIDDKLYEALKRKSAPFDGVSGILRALLMRLINNQ